MRFYSVFTLEEHRPCFKLGLHDPENFPIFCHPISGNEAVRVILVFRTLFVPPAFNQFLCAVYLPLTDPALIVFILGRERNNQVLFQRFCSFPHLSAGQILFDPSIFIKNLIIMLVFIQFINVIYPAVTVQMPA